MSKPAKNDSPKHFNGKEAIEHVIEAQAKGLLAGAEQHGMEIPGHISAGADAARETVILLLTIWLILSQTPLSFLLIFKILGICATSWMIWKMGRSAWLAWSRLERMHRIVEQERWEIQHHRKQERSELKELYRAKGFEGQLLEDVIDVFMADEDRLLKVMVEEELCLSLGAHEHPLKQALGAFLGTLISSLSILFFFYYFPNGGFWVGGTLSLTLAIAIDARYEGNRVIPALVWNFGLLALTGGSAYFLFQYFYTLGS